MPMRCLAGELLTHLGSREIQTCLPCHRRYGKVEKRRGGGRRGELLLPAAFADAGASVLAIAPFPLPAHRTQRADFPHCALRLASRGAHGGHM